MPEEYGLIFDVDGVLADTEGVYGEAAAATYRELYGAPATGEDFVPFIGNGAVPYITGPAARFGITVDAPAAIADGTERFVAMLDAGAEVALPGKEELVARVRAAGGWKLALATSTPEYKSRKTLKAARVAIEDFDAYIHGDMATHQKPDPELYLLAAEALGMAPARCVVIEDAVNGIRAAKAAGMKCIALPNSFPREKLSEADQLAGSLADIQVTDLYGLLGLSIEAINPA